MPPSPTLTRSVGPSLRALRIDPDGAELVHLDELRLLAAHHDGIEGTGYRSVVLEGGIALLVDEDAARGVSSLNGWATIVAHTLGGHTTGTPTPGGHTIGDHTLGTPALGGRTPGAPTLGGHTTGTPTLSSPAPGGHTLRSPAPSTHTLGGSTPGTRTSGASVVVFGSALAFGIDTRGQLRSVTTLRDDQLRRLASAIVGPPSAAVLDALIASLAPYPGAIAYLANLPRPTVPTPNSHAASTRPAAPASGQNVPAQDTQKHLHPEAEVLLRNAGTAR